MNEKLSVIMPVHKAQSQITNQVVELLEVLTDLTSSFEIVIVDDGSEDMTLEAIYELASEYPQVRFARHTRHRGSAAAVETGLAHSRGEIVFVHDHTTPLRAGMLRSLWELRDDAHLDMAEIEPLDVGRKADEPTWLTTLQSWGSTLKGGSPKSNAFNDKPATCMFRRSTLETPNGRLILQRIEEGAESDQAQGPKFLKRLKRFALSE